MSDDLVPRGVGLRANRRENITQQASQPVQLIDEVEDDGNALIAYVELLLEITDQHRAREIYFGKAVRRSISIRNEPASFDPSIKGVVLDTAL
jgi:hypothetical protein